MLGDPTDSSIKLRPLEPASGQALARDLVLKTRRRKGLGDQIAVSKYLDDEFVVGVVVQQFTDDKMIIFAKTACTLCFWACGLARIGRILHICILFYFLKFETYCILVHVLVTTEILPRSRADEYLLGHQINCST